LAAQFPDRDEKRSWMIHIAELSASFFSGPSARTRFVMRREFDVADAVHERVAH
jgi:hypothetical protein